jgi:hypothetical protein
MSDFIHMRILLQIIKYLQILAAIPLPVLQERWGFDMHMNVSSHASVILICETKRDLPNVWNIDGGSEYARNIPAPTVLF